MANGLQYRSTIKSRPYLYLELKKAAALYSEGYKEFEIKDMAINENLFQVNTESRKREVASIVLKRLKVLDNYLIEKILNGSLETSKLIALYSILKTDRLFFEFMNEVFKDKLFLGDPFLLDKDFNIFFQNKAEQSDKVASWKEYTFYKLQQVYIRILFEAGLIKNQKGEREIIPPLKDEEIVSHLKKTGNEIYMEAMGVK